MTPHKRNKTIYWALTLIIFVPATVGAAIELFTGGPQSIAHTMLSLGYPLYLMRILGFAKLLGGIAIVSGKLPTMKEWAYAGFAFDFLGATASHALTGDTIHAIYPLIFFALLIASYRLWHETAATPTQASETTVYKKSHLEPQEEGLRSL